MPGCVVRNAEQLGRRIFSQKTADRAYRGRVLPKVFDIGDDLISVDRLSVAPLDDVEQAAQRTSGDRAPVQGWAVVDCSTVRASDARVRASPEADNPYHADIVVPLAADPERTRLRKERAQDLAKTAQWRGSSVYVCPCRRERGELAS